VEIPGCSFEAGVSVGEEITLKRAGAVTVDTTAYTIEGFETDISVDTDTAGGNVTLTTPPPQSFPEDGIYVTKLGTGGDVLFSPALPGSLDITAENGSIHLRSNGNVVRSS